MPKSKTYLFFILFAFSSRVSYTQTNIHNLLLALKTDHEDSGKVMHLCKLSHEYRVISEYKKGLAYGEMALQLARYLDFKKGIAIAYSNMGNIFFNQANYTEALKDMLEAGKIYMATNNKLSMADTYNNIGNIYLYMGHYNEALRNHVLALETEEELKCKIEIAKTFFKKGIENDSVLKYILVIESFMSIEDMDKALYDLKLKIIRSYNNIGVIEDKQGNYAYALMNYKASLKLKHESGETNDEMYVEILINIGNIYYRQKDYANALRSFTNSFLIAKELKDRQAMASSLSNAGNVYYQENRCRKALHKYRVSLKIKEKIGDKEGMASTNNNMGAVYKKKRNYYKALSAYFASLKIAEEIGDKEDIVYAHINIGLMQNELHKTPEAKRYFDMALKISEETGNPALIEISKNSLANLNSLSKKVSKK